MSRTTLSALAAGACIALAATPALGASARIDPVYDNGSSVYASATIALQPADSCTVAYSYGVYGGSVGDGVGAIWTGRAVAVNACAAGRSVVYEDMSVTTRVGGTIMPSRYLARHHRYLLNVRVCSTIMVTGRVSCHTSWRSFWAR